MGSPPLPAMTPVPPQPVQQARQPDIFIPPPTVVIPAVQRLRRVLVTAAQPAIDFSGLPPADVYRVRYFGRTTNAAAVAVQLRLGGSAGANYFANQLDASNATTPSENLAANQGVCGSLPTPASANTGCGTIDIFGCNQSVFRPTYTYLAFRLDGAAAGNTHTMSGGGELAVNGVVNEITLMLSAGSWDVGSWVIVQAEPAF